MSTDANHTYKPDARAYRLGMDQLHLAKSEMVFAVQAEPATTAWFAVRLGPSTFAIFDAFPDEAGRQAHLTGRVAEALMAKASELLSAPPTIEKVDVLAAKLPAGSQ